MLMSDMFTATDAENAVRNTKRRMIKTQCDQWTVDDDDDGSKDYVTISVSDAGALDYPGIRVERHIQTTRWRVHHPGYYC